MAARGDAQRYRPEAERQIPLAVKYADPWILDAIETAYRVTRTEAVMMLASVEAHPAAVSYSRREAWYRRATYRHPLISSYTAVVRGIDRLADLGLIRHFRQIPGGLGWQSAISATDALVAGVQRLLLGGPRLRLVAPRALTFLRDANGMEIPYREPREIARQERTTARLNEAITGADIRLDGDAPGPFNLASPMRRGYNADFRHGGRFFAQGRNWQNVPGWKKPSPNRSDLLINGAPVVELDYSAFHPSLLYAEVGVAPPADCYDIDNWPRDLVKLSLLVLVNATAEPQARFAIAHSKELLVLGKEGREAVEVACRLIRDIKRAHRPIAHLFHTGAGLRLMRTDSDLAEQIMKDLIIAKGIVALPVHDSYIVPASKRADLEEAMDAAPGQLGLPRLRFKAA